MSENRKLSRLQTWERAILLIAASGKIFSIMMMLGKLKKIYPDINYNDVSRAIRVLLELGYLEENPKDPYFKNANSYICSAAGHHYQSYVQQQDSRLWNLIMSWEDKNAC